MLRRLDICIALACIAIAGCGGKKMPETVPISGTVTVNGKPTAGLLVRFLPEPNEKGEGTSFYSSGTTDAQGKYVLEYDYDGKHGQGASLGPHRVVVMDTTQKLPAPGKRQAPPAIPYTYASPATSPLKADVIVDQPTIDFDIKK